MKISEQNSILNEKYIELVSGGTITAENTGLTVAKKSFLAKHHKAIIVCLSVVTAVSLAICVAGLITLIYVRRKCLATRQQPPKEQSPVQSDVSSLVQSPVPSDVSFLEQFPVPVVPSLEQSSVQSDVLPNSQNNKLCIAIMQTDKPRGDRLSLANMIKPNGLFICNSNKIQTHNTDTGKQVRVRQLVYRNDLNKSPMVEFATINGKPVYVSEDYRCYQMEGDLLKELRDIHEAASSAAKSSPSPDFWRSDFNPRITQNPNNSKGPRYIKCQMTW